MLKWVPLEMCHICYDLIDILKNEVSLMQNIHRNVKDKETDGETLSEIL